MARRISTSQLRNKLRQAGQKARQAANKYNQAVRRHNTQVKQAVNRYNQAVRSHNSAVRARRQRIKNELAKLNRSSAKTHHVVFRGSVHTMHQSYVRLEHWADTQQLPPEYDELLDLSEREAANSLRVMNALDGVPPDSDEQTPTPDDLRLTDQLRLISPELDDRWRGAVFSLDSRNPDAARHFCTSSRELITQILEIKAPDVQVLTSLPDCDLTDQGKPTRRAKIRYFLHQKGMLSDAVEDFVEHDMKNVVELFNVFNQGTHGSAGKFDLHQLSAVKTRVEDAVLFLSSLVN